MNTSFDYLRDLAANPRSTVGDVAARLKAKETAVSQQFRRLQEPKRLWIASDGGKPERFTLTEAGIGELQKLDSAPTPTPTTAPAPATPAVNSDAAANDAAGATNPAQPPSLLRKLIAEAAKEFGLLDNDFLSERVADLEEEKAELEKENRALSQSPPSPEVIELYAVEMALASVSRSLLRTKKENLLDILPEAVSAKIVRLVELEKELAEERDSWWGVDEKRVEALERESHLLRAELGFEPPEEITPADEAPGDEAPGSEPDDGFPDPDDEFLR